MSDISDISGRSASAARRSGSAESFTIRGASRDDSAAARAVVFAVLTEYGLTPDPDDTDRDLDDVERSYIARGGAFRIVESAAEGIVGCGGLLPLSVEEVELRKMYLLPGARGVGLGKRLLGELIAEARRLGFRRIVLETATVLEEAIGLYQSFGFERTERDHGASRCDQNWKLELSRWENPRS